MNNTALSAEKTKKQEIEETNVICIFQSDSRTKVIEDIHKAMKHIDDDELLELSVRVAGKQESISDEEYAGLVLEAAE